jgi:hypothetical protein
MLSDSAVGAMWRFCVPRLLESRSFGANCFAIAITINKPRNQPVRREYPAVGYHGLSMQRLRLPGMDVLQIALTEASSSVASLSPRAFRSVLRINHGQGKVSISEKSPYIHGHLGVNPKIKNMWSRDSDQLVRGRYPIRRRLSPTPLTVLSKIFVPESHSRTWPRGHLFSSFASANKVRANGKTKHS